MLLTLTAQLSEQYGFVKKSSTERTEIAQVLISDL